MINSILRALTKTRTTLFTGVVAIGLTSFSNILAAQEWTLSPAVPPAGALHLLPDPHGFVTVIIGKNGTPPVEPTTVSLHPFWTSEGARFNVRLKREGVSEDGKGMKIEPGQPIKLQAQGIHDGQLVWGALMANIGGTEQVLPLVLGHFGPVVEKGGKLSIPAAGRGRLSIDIGRYRAYGSKARFELTSFRSSAQDVPVRFVRAADGELTEFLEVTFPEGQDTVSLEIDASSLLFKTSYTGGLRTVIGTQTFNDTPLVLTRENWTRNATFAPIREAQGKGPLLLHLSTSKDQAIFGVAVSSDTPATNDFDPRNDLEVSMLTEEGEVSLWTLDATDTDQILARALQPGGRNEVVVKAKRELVAGTYETTLSFGALNVDPANKATAKVTFVVREHPSIAIIILVVAVLFSYATSKGLATALRRRNLRQRIATIKRASWLRRDRWGALPIVRAFARVAMADRALSQKHGFKRLLRIVTAPELIAHEITEVEKRLEVLERLDKLAIYWKAAPSASGLEVSGVDPVIVRRAQKILRRIVDRLSQLREGEEVGTAITGDIEALEAWAQREHMQAGYWASLNADVQLLLDTVDVDQFDFDDDTRLQLEDELRNAESQASDDDVKQALMRALKACAVAHEEGTQAVREALTSVLDRVSNADPLGTTLSSVENSEREIVRRLRQAITAGDTPATLNAMIRLEKTYAKLKLIWEQRDDPKRRSQLHDMIQAGTKIKQICKWLDDEVWALLTQKGVVKIAPPGEGRAIEAYEPIDFKVVCTNQDANTFLFKHGLEYSWKIDFGGKRPLSPITRSTTVTQFIPEATKVKVELTMHYGDKTHPVDAVEFDTIETTQFKHLWPVPTVELIGIGIAFILAFVAGVQSDAFAAAQAGSWNEYLTLFAWGIGADQTRNLLQNLDTFTKGKDAPAA